VESFPHTPPVCFVREPRMKYTGGVHENDLRRPCRRQVTRKQAVGLDMIPNRAGLGRRARSHSRLRLPLIRFIPDSPRESVPLYLDRQCDRTLSGPAPRRSALSVSHRKSIRVDTNRFAMGNLKTGFVWRCCTGAWGA
jgi:hypothetical protein